MVPKQNSVTEVEALRRKQAQFEEDLEAQLDRLHEVQELAEEMTRQKHYDSDNIKAKSRALALRCSTQHFLFVRTVRKCFGSTRVSLIIPVTVACVDGGSCSSRADLVMKLWLSRCSSCSSCPAATR